MPKAICRDCKEEINKEVIPRYRTIIVCSDCFERRANRGRIKREDEKRKMKNDKGN